MAPTTVAFDCGSGRGLLATIPRDGTTLAVLTFADPDRAHPALAWRDEPTLRLLCEGSAWASYVMALVAGTITPAEFGREMCRCHPRVLGSEWRRAVVTDFCMVAVRAGRAAAV